MQTDKRALLVSLDPHIARQATSLAAVQGQSMTSTHVAKEPGFKPRVGDDSSQDSVVKTVVSGQHGRWQASARGLECVCVFGHAPCCACTAQVAAPTHPNSRPPDAATMAMTMTATGQGHTQTQATGHGASRRCAVDGTASPAPSYLLLSSCPHTAPAGWSHSAQAQPRLRPLLLCVCVRVRGKKKTAAAAVMMMVHGSRVRHTQIALRTLPKASWGL